MKNSKNNFRIFAVALVALFSVALTTSATAAEPAGNDPVTVKHIGYTSNGAIFQLSFFNEKEEQFEISVSDKFSTIYYEKIKGTDLVRKFQFYSTDADGGSVDDELIVVITNTTTKEVTSYKILPNASVKKESGLVAKL